MIWENKMKNQISILATLFALAAFAPLATAKQLESNELKELVENGVTINFKDGSRSFFFKGSLNQYAFPPSKYFIKNGEICIHGRYKKWGCDQIHKEGNTYYWKNGSGKKYAIKSIDPVE